MVFTNRPEAVNDSEMKQVCLDILEHTETHAAWIAKELTEVTKKFLLKLASLTKRSRIKSQF